MIDREEKSRSLRAEAVPFLKALLRAATNERRRREVGMDSGSRYLSRSIRVEAARELGLGNWAGLDQNEARIPLGWQVQVYY